MKIAEKSVVSIHYTLTDAKGKVLDSSDGSEPLEYLHGFGNIIPGLEAALVGKGQGDRFEVTVEPADAYGERDEKLVQRVPKNQFPSLDQVKVGAQFQARGPHGPMVLTVVGLEGDSVVVDGNPELAGQTLTFKVEVTAVRAATSEELEHGHVHGPGGHHHG